MARLREIWPALLFAFVCPGVARADDAPAIEFFEREVRPILIARCQACHGSEKQKGGLRLDSKAGALTGGDSGPAVVPGKPGESPLVEAINYGEDVKMPPKSKLPPTEIATLTKWVAMGAPWPESSAAKAAGSAAGSVVWGERSKHWSFQPVRHVPPPAVKDESWPAGPIDRFLLNGLEAKGLKPAHDTGRRTWIRRVTFDLIGLPPRPAEVETFVSDADVNAFGKVVDRLLSSPQYGERWGRHWLDLMRFAETAGHEFDYNILDAWRYRDYVVRAFNADLPYDQFVVEHLAGDLLASPRKGPDGAEESVLGTGFFSLGEGTHSPVDLREEEAARIDNQVDVVGKAFLGLTLACARCHDHKFDPISTKDYYGLTGYLKSSRHQHAFIDPPGRNGVPLAELTSIKNELATIIIRALPLAKGELEGVARSTRTAPPSVPSLQGGKAIEPTTFADDGSIVFEDFNRPTYDGWFVTGEAFGDGPSRAGSLRIQAGDTPPTATSVPPGIAHSGLVSDRLQGVIRSRTFVIEHPFIQYYATGKGGRINLVVDGFEKIRSPIYGGLTLGVDTAEPRWMSMDVTMWLGHRAYIELGDGATVNFTTGLTHYFDGEGFLAVDEIRVSDQPAPPAAIATKSGPKVVPLTDPAMTPLLARTRAAEAKIARPNLALAIADGTEEDSRVNVRGSPRTLGDLVPRRFLELLTGRNPVPTTSGSGRLDLAKKVVAPSNPLTARVMVNRIWKHHFGEGLVRSPDDFGHMGQPPSDPALLDWLASTFVADGWSIKAMHRRILLSHAYRMSSTAIPGAEAVDPSNRLLHRMNVRRLDAESVRDAMLAVSGRLDLRVGGPSIPTHLTPFMEGRGRPSKSGPLDGEGRRSLYLDVRRNFLSPLLLAFDFPAPATCIGRRNVSNVPAQALTLLNDPFVIAQANLWSERVRADSALPAARLDSLYRTAFGRLPSDRERAESLAFVQAMTKEHDEARAWGDLCHVLINAKEFVFVE